MVAAILDEPEDARLAVDLQLVEGDLRGEKGAALGSARQRDRGGATVAQDTFEQLAQFDELGRMNVGDRRLQQLLARVDTTSHCPYKGQADYWSLSLGEIVVQDVAWSYRTPLPESQKIAGLVSFYPEKVDLYVDGRLQR